MSTNSYIDEIAFWDYDESTGEYTKLHTERAMNTGMCLHAVTAVCPARALLDDVT